jgi:hypothetical protein
MAARLAFVLVVSLAGMAMTPIPALGASEESPPLLALQTGAEEEAEGQEGSGQGEGQSGAGAESGAGGQTEGGESTQSEVPWTFQMARLSVLLVLLLLAAIGLLYYRLVVKRQRGEI